MRTYTKLRNAGQRGRPRAGVDPNGIRVRACAASRREEKCGSKQAGDFLNTTPGAIVRVGNGEWKSGFLIYAMRGIMFICASQKAREGVALTRLWQLGMQLCDDVIEILVCRKRHNDRRMDVRCHGLA